MTFQHNHGCPGSAAREFQPATGSTQAQEESRIAPKSQLQQWPVQLMLVPTHAGWFTGADLAITADCVPFAFADFQIGRASCRERV